MILVAAVAIVAITASARAANRRRKELLALARELGWAFEPGYGRPEPQHKAFGHFRQGHSQRPLNTFRGSLDISGRPFPCTMGDFEYKVTRSNGKTTTTSTHRFSYVLLRLPFAAVPGLTIRPENFFDKIAGAVGFDDIDFESERFSRKFFVKSSDKKFAYSVIHPRMMEWLLEQPGTILIDNGWCCLTEGFRCWDAAQFRSRLEWGRRFFSLWPDFVLQDLETRGGVMPMRNA
jgi:hypothetical protein